MFSHSQLSPDLEWHNDPKYKFYWQSRFNTNESYLKCLDHYMRTFAAMKKSTMASHEATLSQLEDLNCVMPIYMSSNKVSKIEELKLDPIKKPKHERKTRTKSDIDEEYIKFYQEGLKYKENYAKKDKAKQNQKIEEDEEANGLNLAWIAQEREAELKNLYGQNWQKIFALETELQAKYDRNIDLYQPKYWPHFPLRIKFQ